MNFYVRSGNMMEQVDALSTTEAVALAIIAHVKKIKDFYNEHTVLCDNGKYPYETRYGFLIKVSIIGYECNTDDEYFSTGPILNDIQNMQNGESRIICAEGAADTIDGLDFDKISLRRLEQLCS